MNRFWNQHAVDGLFGTLAGSFRPASPLDLALFVAALIGLSVLYVLLNRRVRLALSARRRTMCAAILDERLQELALSPGEAALVGVLIEQTQRPAEQGYLVVTDLVVFRRARERLAAARPQLAAQLPALAVRLGFTAREAGRIIQSTADIPPDSPLATQTGAAVLRVQAVAPEGLLCELLDPQWYPGTGREICLYLLRSDAKFELNSTILQREGDRVLLQHAAHLRRFQQRSFFRHPAAWPVRIDRSDGRTLDVSGGGFSARLTGSLGGPSAGRTGPAAGDTHDIAVELHLPDGGSVRAQARAVGLPDDGPVNDDGRLRFAFTRIRPGDRDRLIRALTEGARQTRAEMQATE